MTPFFGIEKIYSKINNGIQLNFRESMRHPGFFQILISLHGARPPSPPRTSFKKLPKLIAAAMHTQTHVDDTYAFPRRSEHKHIAAVAFFVTRQIALTDSLHQSLLHSTALQRHLFVKEIRQRNLDRICVHKINFFSVSPNLIL
jgi:hypothetical protein